MDTLQHLAEGFAVALTGAEVDAYVKRQVQEYRKLAQEFGLAVTKP